MELSSVKRFTYIVNTTLLLIVLGLLTFFYIIKVKFLILFSIPTILVYIVGYVLIHKDLLAVYVRLVYFWITLYMCVTTVCLGYGYGFHLYCLSLIPTIFVTEYISYKIDSRKIRALPFSLVIAAVYLISTGYVAYFGSIYDRDQKTAAFFWIFNALTVFGFIIFYSAFLISSIIKSEEKLTEAAHVDRLTGLYNRHYMLKCLERLPSGSNKSAIIAMSDIDNFKKINDTYGHNGGDEVLRVISEKMRTVCKGCTVARWGGEEFLILSTEPMNGGKEMLENLRKSVASEPVSFEGKEISVTLTIGVAVRGGGQSIDEWIQAADSKLYTGKNTGKNKVVE
ncbi:MAG: GGDEF domain-containing protein [Ruminococcus sp.]|nr:GGDEF domain-containing protein [Ruminococcus sp.]